MKHYVGMFILLSSTAFSGEFSSVEVPVAECPGNFFVKKAEVFDSITVCATALVSDSKLVHAANVAAQWLDNNEDGKVDEPNIISFLKESNATLLMSKKGFSDSVFQELEPYFDTMVGQDLSSEETNPTDRRDASQEEIHHLIVNAGWQKYQPRVFSDEKSTRSTIYQQWSLAEDNKFYHYDDPTCDDACKTVEFLYLSTAAYLNAQTDLESDEMRIKSRTDLRRQLPDLVRVFESNEYRYPTTKWPNGRYAYADHIVYEGLSTK